MNDPEGAVVKDHRARVAVDLGAESCRVSLLRWNGDRPEISEVHRIPNGPVDEGGSQHWPLGKILAGLEEGLRQAGETAREGIASVAVDGWAVDYVRLDESGKPIGDPFCYRDERTILSKARADANFPPKETFQRNGAQPLRINTAYQLMADAEDVAHAPWSCLPEYVLHWLGAPRVAEFTNATHTGLVDPRTGNWARDVFDALRIPMGAAPPIVATGTRLGRMRGPLAALPAFRETELIAPACHDTASAIAGIPAELDSTAYICSGTWSLVGTVVEEPITTAEALAARYTNQGAATGGFCFHTNVNGMWLLKQCMEAWSAAGRGWTVAELVKRAAEVEDLLGTVNVDAEPLLLAGEMPKRINEELKRGGQSPIPDVEGNEPVFARLIFESLAERYMSALSDLEKMLGCKIARAHMIGGASRNRLLADLASRRCGIPVVCGHPESSTIGNFAVQLATWESGGEQLTRAGVRKWSASLCEGEFETLAEHP